MKKKILNITLLLISIGLITFGLSKNQNKDVLVKAINICLECVGIG